MARPSGELAGSRCTRGWVVTLRLFRTLRYVEYRPPVLDPEVDEEGVTLQARQNYEISCHGHKPLTWIIPGLNDNRDRQKRSVLS